MMLIPHESDATRQIRFDIVTLGQALADVEADIDAFERAMYAFEREYQKRLGDIAEAVLVLRAQLGMLSEQSKAAPSITQLADDDYQQLKVAYRLAAKLCHPDYLPDNRREMGLSLFDTLNKAYHLQDIVTVEHILWLLQSGQAFSDTPVVINDSELLQKRKILLEYLIAQQTDRLAQLKMREDYDVSNRDNWNILLYDYQTQLEDELAMLRGRANALK